MADYRPEGVISRTKTRPRRVKGMRTVPRKKTENRGGRVAFRERCKPMLRTSFANGKTQGLPGHLKKIPAQRDALE